MSDETQHDDNARRRFLKRAATVSGALPFSQGFTGGAAAVALVAPATAAPTSAPQEQEWVGYTSLSPEEAGFTEALVNVMCPADEFTPDGVACGLAVYIDQNARVVGGARHLVSAFQPHVRCSDPAGHRIPAGLRLSRRAGGQPPDSSCRAPDSSERRRRRRASRPRPRSLPSAPARSLPSAMRVRCGRGCSRGIA